MYLYKLGRPEKERFRGLDEALTEDLAVEITNAVINGKCVGEFEGVTRDQIHYLMRQRRENPVQKHAMSLGYQSKLPSRYCGPDCDRWFREHYPDDLRRQPGDPIRLAHLDEFEREIETMRKKNKEEELRTLFYEAKFSGSMLKIGRLIERTLGKGTFRLIAEDFLGKDLQDRLRLYKKKGQ